MEHYMDFIEINPKIMLGKPVIKGTRITVELILDKLAAGESMEQILESYPHINREQVKAAITFASHALKGEKSYPLSYAIAG